MCTLLAELYYSIFKIYFAVSKIHQENIQELVLIPVKWCYEQLTMVDQIQEINKPQDWEYVVEKDNSTFKNYTLDPHMQFNEGHVVSIVAYSILMVIAAVGNITVLVILLRRRRNVRSRINTMVMHLAIADLMVS